MVEDELGWKCGMITGKCDGEALGSLQRICKDVFAVFVGVCVAKTL